MICGLCNYETWNNFKEESYHLDYLILEDLYLKLNSEQNTLGQLIDVASTYKEYVKMITKVVKNGHELCECICCGHKTDLDLKLQDKIINQLIVYYSGLSEYRVNVLERLTYCLKEMKDIDNMIGMESIKEDFARLMKYLASNNENDLLSNGFMMNMVIMGPPGHGKTEIAKLLGKALQKSGLLKSDKFIIATRSDLIGAYCGHTAKATTKMFNDAEGGILFIDEVYSLGNSEKRDVFTKECIDTINSLLSERSDTICIVAGYEEDIDKCFFSYNAGLERRFPWRFHIKAYNEQDLIDIFYKKVNELGYVMSDDIAKPSDINLEHFPNAGGDIANLITKCIMAHNENKFLNENYNAVTRRDFIQGLKKYTGTIKIKRAPTPPPFGMYI